MTDFLQLHILTSYPPANLNRDDLSRPKTAFFGGTPRLRVSSQCLKRTWRTAEPFTSAVVAERRGTRTKEIGERIYENLVADGVSDAKADEVARAIAERFGKLSKKGARTSETLVFYSARELAAIDALARACAEREAKPTADELNALLLARTDAIDIALFGRMLADDPGHNVEAAAQVAHAITVHSVAVEDDFYSAVDDLNTGEESRGAGHLGDAGFGAGVFYVYACIDLTRLAGSLGDPDAVTAGIRGLVEAALTAAPKGKQNSFASRAYASYVLAERGERQPRTLATAFLQPVTGGDLVVEAIRRLRTTRDAIDRAYGPVAARSCEVDVPGGAGTLAALLDFCAEGAPA